MRYAFVVVCFVYTSAVYAQTTFRACGPTGTAKGDCATALNVLKNRDTAPTKVDPAITLRAMLTSGDDVDRWAPEQGAEITGYVADVSPGGLETCNCKNPDLNDIHIDVVADPKDAGDGSKTVVVELTPRWQAKKHWTISAVRKQIKHRWVTFRGWMLLDTTHVRSAKNTRTKQGCGNLPAGHVWRATAWEVHPVTDFEVVGASTK